MSEHAASEQHRPVERTVTLGSSGFVSCVVRAPTWAAEDSLDWFFRHTARANTSAFVTELLAACLVPARWPREVAVLPETDRARLRRAVVAVCDREGEWRRLRGSHMTADERLMAVMVWRWRERERLLARLRERRRELVASAETAVEVVTGVTSAAEQVRKSMSALSRFLAPVPDYTRLFPDYSKLMAPFPDYAKLVPGLPDVSKLARPFPDPAQSAAIRLVRSLYADPSPLVLHRVGPESTAWGKSVQTALGLGEPAWLQTVQKMTNSIVGTKTMRLAMGNLASQRAIVPQMNFKLPALLGAGSLATLLRVPALVDVAEMLRRYSEPLRELAELMEEAGRFILRWERRALWYLLSQLGFHALRRLAPLDEAAVEEAVLLALETLIADGEVVPALRTAVAKAPHLDDTQRIHLDHMLEHAAEGSYVKASAPLYPGLEGAFGEVAYRRALITADRTRVDNPNKKVKFETMIKQLGLEEEFEIFMAQALFGTAGNPYRHGYRGVNSSERRQVLFGIAALGGWLHEFANVPALDVLIERMERALPAAINRVQVRALGSGT